MESQQCTYLNTKKRKVGKGTTGPLLCWFVLKAEELAAQRYKILAAIGENFEAALTKWMEYVSITIKWRNAKKRRSSNQNPHTESCRLMRGA